MAEQKISEDPAFKEILMMIAGQHGYEVASALVDKELTDEEVARRTGIRINLVRKILYDLYDNRVVNYRRVRDEDSGWYIYYWRVEPERAMEFFNTNRRLLLRKLEERLERERSVLYFKCSEDCPKLGFEEAAENNFRCPRCGGQLVYYDNRDVIRALERQIESLRQKFTGG